MNRSSGLVSLYAALAATAAFGLLYDLGDRLLWADEAETALLAVNITTFGLPVADDGRNDLSRTRPGSESEHSLWIWSPWLDEYVAAGSFIVFGKSTWSARLPFALIALASVGLLGWIAWRVSRNHELVLMAVLLYATCVPFLLHARQARYYAIVMFAQLWILYGVHRCMLAPSLRSAAHVCAGLVAIFYCNYILLPGNVLGLALAGLLLARRHPRLPFWLLGSGLAALALALPWLLYARPTGQAALLGFQNFGPYLLYYVGELHHHVVSLGVLLLLPLLVGALERWGPGAAASVSSDARSVWEASEARELRVVMSSLVLGQLLFLGFAPDRFFRYLTPLIPLALLLLAFVLLRFVAFRWLRLALLAILVGSNALATGMALPFPKRHELAITYPRFVHSIQADYRDRLEAVVDYLAGEAQPEDSVYVDDHELPLIFYTGVRIQEARDSRPSWQEGDDVQPDWVLPTGPSALVNRRQLRFTPGPRYERQSILVPRSPRGGSRPHPDAHAFFTAEASESFVLYRKKARSFDADPGSPQGSR